MAAFAMARQPGSSPGLSGPAWRRTAQASAIACDLGARALELLAQQPSSLIASGTSEVHLRATADVLMQAREMWRQTAWMWQAMTTDTSSTVSVTTADASGLVLRMGRLVFGDREWTPAGTRGLLPRDPASLASDLGSATVLSAVHEAADAIARMAHADLDAIRSVHRAGRMYMPDKTLGDLSAKRAYAAAPANRVRILANAYYLCADTGARAVTVLDGLSAEIGAPSRILALIHAASPSGRRVGDPEPGFILDPAAFADRLELFGRLKGRPGARNSQLDPQAIIRVASFVSFERGCS